MCNICFLYRAKVEVEESLIFVEPSQLISCPSVVTGSFMTRGAIALPLSFVHTLQQYELDPIVLLKYQASQTE